MDDIERELHAFTNVQLKELFKQYNITDKRRFLKNDRIKYLLRILRDCTPKVFLNDDTLFQIMLKSDSYVIKNICLTCKKLLATNSHFWLTKSNMIICHW